MNNYIVYMHTFPDGKKYVGISIDGEDPNKRWKNGFGYTRNVEMFYDIVRVGWENILHEILYTNLSKSEAEQKEAELIKEYDSIENGYNRLSGYGIRQKYADKIKEVPFKKVLCIETGITYHSIAEAGRELNLPNPYKIPGSIKRNGTCYGYHWKLVD